MLKMHIHIYLLRGYVEGHRSQVHLPVGVDAGQHEEQPWSSGAALAESSKSKYHSTLEFLHYLRQNADDIILDNIIQVHCSGTGNQEYPTEGQGLVPDPSVGYSWLPLAWHCDINSLQFYIIVYLNLKVDEENGYLPTFLFLRLCNFCKM